MLGCVVGKGFTKITLPEVQLDGLRNQLPMRGKKHRDCKQRLTKLHAITFDPL